MLHLSTISRYQIKTDKFILDVYKMQCNTNINFRGRRRPVKMALFTFEGDFEVLAEPQIKLVESVLQKRGYKDGKVLVEPVGRRGDNFIANVKRFIYEAKDGSTFKMIGKIAPVDEEVRMMMKTMILFNNEITMYNTVLPKLNNIQNSAGITEEEKVKFPACYGVVTEAPYEFVLLEDLKEIGFVMFNKFQALSNECIRLVIKDLARYHSLLYVLKNNEPETYKSVAAKMLDIWTMLNDSSKPFFENAENDLIHLMRDSSEKYKKILNGSLTQLGQIAKAMESYEKGSKYALITQGDCWTNNILFRLENGKPVQDVMIDYQLSRERNPAADILCLIFNCTDHVLRLKHYQEWIDHYHEILDESLNKYELKANYIFPKYRFEADLRRYGRTIVNTSVMLATMIIKESKDVEDLEDKTEEILPDIIKEAKVKKSPSLGASSIKLLKERIMDIVDSALEFGLVSL